VNHGQRLGACNALTENRLIVALTVVQTRLRRLVERGGGEGGGQR